MESDTRALRCWPVLSWFLAAVDNCTLFAQADMALLDAKRNGKNRIYLVGGPKNDIDQIK